MITPGKGLYSRLMVIISFSVIIPIFVLTLGSLYLVREQVIRSAVDDLEQQAAFRARFIEAWLLNPVILTMRLSEKDSLSRDLQQLDQPGVRDRLMRVLNAFIKDQPNVQTVAFLDVRGSVVLGVDRKGLLTGTDNLGIDNPPVFSSAMSNPYPVSLARLYRPEDPYAQLGYFREIRDAAGHITHRLLVSYRMDVFQELPELGGRSWLLNETGAVLESSGLAELPAPGKAIIEERLPYAIREQAVTERVRFPEGEMIVSSNRIAIPSTGSEYLILLTATPESVYLSAFYGLGLLIAAGALIVILLTAVVYSVVVRRTTQPLNDLAQAVENIGALDWEGTRNLKVVRDDEVGLLTKRFISMSKQLGQAFARLTRLNSRLIVTLRSIVDGVIVTDAEEQVSLINTAAEELTGWSTRSARGVTVKELLPEEYEEPIFYRSREGGTSWIIIRRAEMKSVEGVFLGSVYTIRDITKEREYLDQLVRARDAAEAANQTKSEFLAIMSHELRTPLNPIIAFSSLLLTEGNIDSSTREMVQTIHDSARHQLELIQEILDYCAIEGTEQEPELKALQLEDLLQACIAPVRLQAETKGLQFELVREGNLPPAIQTDKRRLCQILQNLLLNGIKFTPEGSVRLRVNASGASIQFFVEDTGIGIAPEDRKKIFEPFTQADSSTSRRFGGTGLGLTISRELARILGGQLDYVEREGPGSSFRLMLPVGNVSGKPCTPEPPREESQAGDLPAYSILLVEDDPPSRRAGKVLLESLGQRVEVAENGEEALEMLKDNTYDILFLDIQLPGISGHELARRLRQELPESGQPLIIAQTAQADAASRELFLRSGIDEVLTKPFSLVEIQRLLESRSAKA